MVGKTIVKSWASYSYKGFNESGFIKPIFIYEKDEKKDVGLAVLLIQLNGVNVMGNSVTSVRIVAYYLQVSIDKLVEQMSSYGSGNGLSKD